MNNPGTLIRVWFTMPGIPGEGWSEYALEGNVSMEDAEAFGRRVRSRFTRVEIVGQTNLEDIG